MACLQEVGKDKSSVIADNLYSEHENDQDHDDVSSPNQVNGLADFTVYGIACWSPLGEPSYEIIY